MIKILISEQEEDDYVEWDSPIYVDEIKNVRDRFDVIISGLMQQSMFLDNLLLNGYPIPHNR